MREIVPGIFVITERSRLSTFMPAVNCYVLAADDGLIFDGGYGNRAMVNQALRQLRDIAAVCRGRGGPFRLTRIMPSHAHPDHVSGLKPLARRLDLAVLLTPRTAHIIASRRNYNETYNRYREPAYARERSLAARALEPAKKAALHVLYNHIYGKAFIDDPDQIIEGESVITVGGEDWRVLATPGHASDHVSLYSAARGILLGGDNVLPGITTWLGPPDSDLALYEQTLERLAGLDPLAMILPAHGGPVTEPRQRIGQLLAGRRRRTDQVLRIVRAAGDGGIALGEILQRLYAGQGVVTRDLARGWVILTIERFLREGTVMIRRGDRGWRICSAD